MTKIRNTGAGPAPMGGPESTENIKDTKSPAETAQTSVPPEATPEKQISGDPYLTGDLKAAGDQMKSQLDSEFERKKAEEQKGLSPEELAKVQAGQIHFAPPYVPVGPVVMEDNIGAPASSGEITRMNLKADQFQINEEGNLVISNEQLIDYFKSMKETGQEFQLSITGRKKREEE